MNQKIEVFLEEFYGALFNPNELFEKLQYEYSLSRAVFIVSAVSILSPLLQMSFNSGENLFLQAWTLVNSAIFGVLCWGFFALFVETLAGIFNCGGKIKIFLCMSAAALSPWIFFLPVSLLKTGGILFKPFAVILGLLVWAWVTVLTLFAIRKTYNVKSSRILTFTAVPVLGGIISTAWFLGFFSTLVNIFK